MLVAASACGSGDAEEARPFPAFTLEDLRDPSATITADALEGRPAVVNLFASWCVPCRRELPALREAAERYGDEVTFLGVDTEDTRAEGLEMLETYGVTYDAAYDPEASLRAKLGALGLPITVFVRADGTIESMKRGEIDADDLEERIEDLLAQS